MTTDGLGIDDGWWGADGSWHDADPDTVALLRARFEESAAAPSEPYWFVDPAEAPGLQSTCAIDLDGGGRLDEVNRLPADLPYGVHRLHPLDGGPTTTLVARPSRLTTWPELPTWGVAVQLYAARSTTGSKVGDLDDLVAVARWAGARGAGVLGVNPLADPVPCTPRQPSPYSPSSRSFLDPLIVPVGDVPPRAAEGADAEPIDRDRAWTEKVEALWGRWLGLGEEEHSQRIATVEARLRGPRTDRATWHGLFGHLAVAHDCGWRQWPAPLQDPASPEVVDAGLAHPGDVAFWCWVDELAEAAVAEARAALRGYGIDLMGDLPVGVTADGFDTWFDRHLYLDGWRIGAPPDPLGPHGQDWGLAPYDPHLLRAAGYGPFVETLRANLQRYDGLRIDHVMGLFRLFVIPPGGSAEHGTYVRTPVGELLDLAVAIAAANGAFLVGEDLGTVEDEVREACRSRGVAGTRVAWFDPTPPEDWPALSLGTLTTHDLPTTAGALAGDDPLADETMAATMRSFAEVPDGHDGEVDAEVEDVVVAAHRRLTHSGSSVVLATLEDLVGSHDRVNLPGTVDEYPNWRVPLPVPVDRLDEHPLAAQLAATLAAARPRLP